jgi:hypothetical protein
MLLQYPLKKLAKCKNFFKKYFLLFHSYANSVSTENNSQIYRDFYKIKTFFF